MADLIRFEFRVTDAEPDEVVSLRDDGSVVRTVMGSVSGASQVGWWRGRVDSSVIGSVDSLRSTLSGPEVEGVPSAAGEWWTIDGARQRADRSGVFAALRSICIDAATDPLLVIGATAWTEVWDGEPGPVVMLRLRAEGDTTGQVRFEHPSDAPVAAFVTDQFETLGFLGSTFAVTPSVEATAVVRGVPVEGGKLALIGTLTPDGSVDSPAQLEPAMVFRLVVESPPRQDVP